MWADSGPCHHSPHRGLGTTPREGSEAGRVLAVGTGRCFWVENRKGSCRDLCLLRNCRLWGAALVPTPLLYHFRKHVHSPCKAGFPGSPLVACMTPASQGSGPLPQRGSAGGQQWYHRPSRPLCSCGQGLRQKLRWPQEVREESRPRPECPGGPVGPVPGRVKTAGVMVDHGSRPGTLPMQVHG